MTSLVHAIIIEDEKPAARRLQRLLEGLGVSVTAVLHAVEEAKDWFSHHPHPELIFLDIQLGDGLSFEIFEAHEVKSAIIFTTAYDEYTLKAFKLNSIDYLLKPVVLTELKAAVEKFLKHRNTFDLSRLKIWLEENEWKRKPYKHRFAVKLGTQLRLFTTDGIDCFFSKNKGTYLHTDENRSYLLDTSLEKLESTLDPRIFFRINRQFIIHIEAITGMTKYTSTRLKIKLRNYNDQPLVVSRKKVSAFMNWLER